MNLFQSNKLHLHYSFSAVFIILFFAFSCDKNKIMSEDNSPFDRIEGTAIQKTSQDLYTVTSGDYETYNFAISPLSIQLALYMVYNGADGQTKEQIGNLLNVIDTDLETVNERVKKLINYYDDLVDDGHLDIHNALFYDENRIELADEFVKRLKIYFDVQKSDLDFSSPAAVASINDWVQEKTYDKIREVIQNISDQEVLFLINALYLKADWVSGFDKQATSDRTFMTSRGDEIMIPTMHRTGVVEHLSMDGFQIVRLPLADSTLYTYLIMPDQSSELPTLIHSEIIPEIWNNTLNFKKSRIMFEMPVVETKTHLSLNSSLQSLGMTAAFDPQQADLHLMGSAKNGLSLVLTRTLHDVYLKMDENGVEGAAVTTIGVGTTSLPPSIQFNRPFMYLIVDQELGLPLFIGQFTGLEPEK